MTHSRMLWIAVALALASCGGSPAPAAAPKVERAEPGCRTPAEVDRAAEEKACLAKDPSCRYTQELTCRGVDVDDATEEAERQASAAGKVPCACVCEIDVQRCAMVP